MPPFSRPSTARATTVGAAIVLALVCAAGLAGCATGDADGAPSKGVLMTLEAEKRTRPAAGDCWQLPEPAADGGAGPTPADPVFVDCAEEHVRITAAVHDLPEDFAYPEADARLEPDAERVVAEVCDDAIQADSQTRSGSRVTWYWTLPSKDAWETGERWLRCDVAVEGMGPVRGGQLELLPATAGEVIAEMYGEYRRCMDTIHEDGPDFGPEVSSESTNVPCDQAQWEAAPPFRFEWQQYSSDRELTDAVLTYCEGLLEGADRHIAVGERYEWTPESSGPGTAGCWMS